MSTPHARPFSRRRFLGGLTLAGTAGLLGLQPNAVVAEPPPETTRLRVKKDPNLCEVPAQVAEELLRAEGFSEVQYVWALGPAATFEKMMAGEIDLALTTALAAMRRIEAGDPLVFLAGVHVGCFELFGHEHVRAIRDLKGKVVAVAYLGGVAHLLTAIMAASVGLDPQQDITWGSRAVAARPCSSSSTARRTPSWGSHPSPRSCAPERSGRWW
jgi:NitT/TauT family transport system substrate-binding protein